MIFTKQSSRQLNAGGILFIHLLSDPGTKKSPPDGFGEPIDTQRMLWYIMALECAARPSGVPSQAPRPAKVLCLAFSTYFSANFHIAGLNFSCSDPSCIFSSLLAGQVKLGHILLQISTDI